MAYREAAYTNGYEFTRGSGYTLPEYPFEVPPEIASGEPGRHAIAIVGGGISGLTLACALAKYGVAAVLLDEDNTVGVKGASSRGICYTQKSLEIFDRLGIYKRIAKKGVQWSVGRTFAGHDEVYAFDLRRQSGYNLSTQPPFINIQQFYIEGWLVERIHELGHVELRWKNRVTGFEQDEAGATLSVETPAGSYRLRAQYVIDASGSHSPFRQWAGASVTAKKGDDRWCIADVRFGSRAELRFERHTWVEAPFNEDRAVWQHPMGDGVWRIDYQMAPDCDPHEVSREDVVRARLERHFGRGADIEIVWVGPYAYKSECIDCMRHGRLFFMGDAAKVVSPFGARGGNSGIADADNLAWKLAAVLQGRAARPLLDTYQEERHEAARQNVSITNRTTRFLRPASPVEKLFRDAALGLARQHEFARQLVNTGRMAVANAYTQSQACHSTGGRSVQNVAFEWGDGSRGTVNELVEWAAGRLLVLLFGSASAAALQRLRELGETADVCCVQVAAAGESPAAKEFVRDPDGHLRGACHVFGHAWALLRPDAYVAATGERIDAKLVHAIGCALGASLGKETP
jgi:3-(3-hydroxy-phenyl)propionate hydroxylase